MALSMVKSVVVFLLCLGMSVSMATADSLAASGVFHMNDGRGRLAAPLRVFYARPDSFQPEGPVVIVVHGAGRTAARYRDYWAGASERYGVLVLAPEFTREHYRGSRQFNLGSMVRRDGSAAPRSEWSFPVIDRVFKAAKAHFRARRPTYYLFGHSAGAQFVHRMVLFAPSSQMAHAIAANAGWYTFPDRQARWPYGFGDVSAGIADLKQTFANRLTIMLGTDDDDPNHQSLRRTEEAMRQGPHRFARGHQFFRAASRAARRLGVPFIWQLKEIPGVAHSGRHMSSAAAHYFFGNPRP